MSTISASTTKRTSGRANRTQPLLPLLAVLILASVLTGCSDEDCLNCVELQAPAVPTGVASISRDNEVIVLWYEVSHPPYERAYNEMVVGYNVYSRYYSEGDEDDPNRKFGFIGYVPWDDPNYDPGTGTYWFFDTEAVNGERYEYAVAAVNAAGVESALSFEFVIDAPLPMSLAPVELFDANDATLGDLAGFDFSALEAGRTDPSLAGTLADIRVEFAGGVPYVVPMRDDVQLLDAGVHSFGDGSLDFDGVSWAPWDGWSLARRLELVPNHIYVAEIIEPDNDPRLAGQLHYAKFGVTSVTGRSVIIHWAFQTIAGLPELVAPEPQRGTTEPAEIVLEF